MSNQNQPPIITIKFVPAGVELVLNALNTLPRGQVEALYQEVLGQYQIQMQELQKQAQAEALIAESKAKSAAIADEAKPEGAAE